MPSKQPALPRFVVFGEALTDFVRTGEQSWHAVAGGACWNVARVASTLGLRSAWGGSVSDDFFGDEIATKSSVANLDMRFLQRVAKPPLIAMVHQAHPPRYFFLGNDSADLAFDVSLLPTGWEDACELAHFGCISLVREPLGSKLLGIAQDLKRRGVRISYDPNMRNLMGPDFPALFEQLASISDILKLSDEDLAQIYPQRSTADALAHVRARAPAALIVFTRGAQGLTLYTADGDSIEQAAFEIAVADTVGAGDACIGGFIASLLDAPQRELGEHLRFAAATAAVVCSKAGAHAPKREEVEALLHARG